MPGQDQPGRQLAGGPQRLDVLQQRSRPGAGGSAASSSGRDDQRVGRDPREQMVAGDQDLPLLVPEDRVRRAVPGRWKIRSVRSRELELLAVAQRDGHAPARAEGAERRGQRPEHGGQVVGHPVAAHDRLGELVVGGGAAREALEVGAEQVQRGHLGARAAGQDLEQAEMIHVLVGEHDQLEVLDPAPVRGERALEVVERLAGVRARCRSG